MNSIIRAASRLATRPLFDRLLTRPTTFTNQTSLTINKRFAHNQPLTFDFVRERILLMLRLFDKVDPEKLTLDSHFVHDLGLDSLDHVEIIMNLEDEFLFEIPDKDAEKLVTPRHMLMYITDKEEAYEELQKLQAASHHHHHDAEISHDHESSHSNTTSAGLLNDATPKRHFSTLSYMSKRFMGQDDTKYYRPTTFDAKPKGEVKLEDIQARVMKVCSKYDKIDSTKLDLASHFVQDLGLDSLDHVEIMMELEDEFGLEIPDQEAEKLMRPVEVARFFFHREEERSLKTDDRPY